MMNSGGMGFEGMAPEDIFAMGIKKGLDLVKDLGRDGDTELVHVNEDEKQALKDMGGRGSVNPATGLHEYPPAGADIEGSGRGRDPTGGGDRDGGRDPAMGRSAASRTRETRALGDARESQAGGGVSGSPTSSGGTAGPSGDTVGGGEDSRNFGQRLADGIAAALKGPSFGPPTGKDPGFLGAAASLAPGIGWGMGLTNALHGMGFESTADFGDSDADQRDGGMLSPGRPQQAQGGQPQAPQYAWQRPGSLPTAPQALGLDAGMTPLQQRAAVATGGTAGNQGIFRDPAIVDFYRNLATYSLTDPSGAPAQGQGPLPVEMQYLTQLGAQPGDNTESFLRALAGL